ncbi:MAG TPA: hypothetical protein DCS97_14550 [Planctomycetes bacterium]|nr:hypothetical protein [Planctomycetota bacterium]
MPSGQRMRTRRGLWITIGCLVVAGIGLSLFALAFRSCRFAVPDGRELAWSLRVATATLDARGVAGPERIATHRLALVGIGPGPGTAALLAGPLEGVPGSAWLVDAPPDGRVRQLGPDGRLAEAAPNVAGFDFNLLPLPLGAEQEWKPEVVWAALPADRRAVTCTVKRLRSGATPQFRCTFPTSVEWIDAATGRYRQVRDLIAIYRFDTLRGVPREARITFTLREELPPPAAFTARRIVMDLAYLGSSSAGDPADLRPLANAAAAAEGWIATRRLPPPEVLARLRTAEGPFRGLVEGMRARLAVRR